MVMENKTAFICLIVTIALLILVPLAFSFYRDWDFKRQVSGKKKMRTLKEGEHIERTEKARTTEMDLLEVQYKRTLKQIFFR